MLSHRDKIQRLVADCLSCDALVVPGSRFSQNLLITLRDVKKRAMLFWIVIISNGVVYIVKPILLPGRHFMEDLFILYGKVYITVSNNNNISWNSHSSI